MYNSVELANTCTEHYDSQLNRVLLPRITSEKQSSCKQATLISYEHWSLINLAIELLNE